MQKTTRDPKWKEFVDTFKKITECDDRGHAMSTLNGIRSGYLRSKPLTSEKLNRIATIKELIGYYK